MSRAVFLSSLRAVPALVLVTALSAVALPAAAQPEFSKSFSPATIAPGSAATLTFVIDNTASGSGVTNLAFTDNLPAAVTLASPASPVNGCGGTLTAPDGGGTITLTGGTLFPGALCTIRVDVTGTVPGTHTNSSGDLTSSAGNSGNAVADLTVDGELPTFTKSFSPTSVQVGGRSTLTFVIDNDTTVDVNRFEIEFSDTLPTGLVVADPSNVATDCPLSPTTGTLSAEPGGDLISYRSSGFEIPRTTILSGGASCTVAVDVVATLAGTFDNRSEALESSTATDGDQLSGIAVDRLTASQDTLALTKEFISDPVLPGDTVTLRFTIGNFVRSDSATGITFSDDLDATLSGLVAVAPLPIDPCGAGSALSGTDDLTLSGGILGAGETCTFDVTLQVPAGAAEGAYPNTTSTVTADRGGSMVTGAAATDTLFVQAVPSITKTFLDPDTLSPVTTVLAGDPVLAELTVTNTSDTDTATEVEFSDNLSAFLAGVTVSSGVPQFGSCGAGSFFFQTEINGTIFLQLLDGTIPAGGSCTFQVELLIPFGAAVGTYTNVTTGVSAVVGGDRVTGAPASAELAVLAAPPLIKGFLAGAAPGGTTTLEFTLALSENSPTPATGISFTDDLEATLTGLTAIGLPADGFCGPGSTITGPSLLEVSGASLDPGESCTFSVTVQVPAGAVPGDYTNTTSQVSATIDGTALTGPGSSSDLRVIGLVLSKVFLVDPVVAGGATTLQFTLDNTLSSLDATDVSFEDDLRTLFSGVDATGLPAPGFCGDSSEITEPVAGDLFVVGASVTAGESCSFSVTVQVPAGTTSAVYINVTGPVTAVIDDSGEILPRAIANLEVIDPLAISKTFIGDPVAPGETVILEFTLTNDSPTDTATGLSFTDDLDAALSGLATTALPASGFCGAGSTISGGGVITVSGARLDPASSCTFPVTVLVPAGAAAGTSVVNTTSTLTGTVGGEAATAPPATDDLRIDLVELTKTFAGPAAAGGAVVLTFEIVNQSVTVISGLGFLDDLDAALSGLVASSLPATPCGGSSSLTGTSTLVFSGGSLGAGESCSFDVTLQVPAGAAAGLYTNTTSGLTSSGEPAGTAASADLEIEPPPVFSKEFVPATVVLDGTSTLRFEIDNTASALPAGSLAFTDDLPAGLEVAATPNASTTCIDTTFSPLGPVTASPGATSISFAGAEVAAGDSCTVEVDVTGTAPGTLVNVSSSLTSSLGDSGTASASLLVLVPEVTFGKEFLGTAIGGGTVDLRFTITNGFTVPVSDLTVSDDLDAVLPGLEAVGLPAVDVCGSGSEVSGTSVIVLTGGNLPAGGVCTFTVILQLPDVVPAPPFVNVTSPLVYDREGVELEAPPATAELVPNVLVIPTLGFWGLLLLAGVLGLLGWTRLR